MTVPGTLLDSGTTDGHGHLFVASNLGQLVVVDYSATGRIGEPRDIVTVVPLHDDLVAVAPLIGPGAQPGSTRWEYVTEVALGLVLILALAFLFVPRRRGARLPSWDLRRREAVREQRREEAQQWRRSRPRSGRR